MTEWFAQWFGETYLQLYPHRNEDDARQALALIDRVVELSGRRVLDLACGEGRHTIQLHHRGAQPVGIDLSHVLLGRARKHSDPALQLVRGDMRCLPFRTGSFEVVLNLFTSFGYFGTDEEHENVIVDVRSLLASGGWFVLDFLNAAQVRNNLVPAEQKQINEDLVEIERRIVQNEKYVEKEMRLARDGSRHVERVRLFTREELETMLVRAGFTIAERCGDYQGGPITTNSPRVILLSRAT